MPSVEHAGYPGFYLGMRVGLGGIVASPFGTEIMASGWSRRSVVATIGVGLFSATVGNAWAADRRRLPSERRGGSVFSAAAAGSAPVTVSEPNPSAPTVKVRLRPPDIRRWPPYAPTARYPFTDPMVQYLGSPESYLWSNIQANLKDVGYQKVHYFALPDGGSALATPPERITRNGTPAAQNRFNIGPSIKWNPLGPKPVPLHVRFILFLLTPTAIPPGEPPKSFAKHRTALESGITQLTDNLHFLPFTHQHRLTAFIYEYVGDGNGEPTFMKDSRISAIEHLINSGIVPKRGR